MRRLALVAAFIVAAFFFVSLPTKVHVGQTGSQSVAAAASINSDILLFATEDAAQKHCLHDTVVWLNTSSGIYHLKGERWYGRTKHGAYVCKKEADAAGYRETENGQ